MVSAPRGLDVEVGTPTLFDQLDASSVQSGDVVLGVGVAARPREAVGFVEEAGAYGAAAVILKLGDEVGPELIDASTRTGVALLAAPAAVAWGHLYTLLRVAGGAATPAGALVDGVPMGDLFALANAIAAMVGGAVTIEDPQSYVLAYSSADLPIDEARREVILGRRVPERFLRRLREAGVFQRLQTTDDVVTYVDQEEEVLPRLAVGIRAGGELLGSIWVAEATESLGPDAKAALQEAGRMAALHLIRHRSSSDLERRSAASWSAVCWRATSIPMPRLARSRRGNRRDRRRPARRRSRQTCRGRPPTPSPAPSGWSALSRSTSNRSNVTSPRSRSVGRSR